MDKKTKFGKVYILGAGPGDPGLLTLKGMQKIRIADVVVFDRLISTDLLSFCKKDCEKIFVGKESGFHPIKQEEIIELLISKAKEGKYVVRLKGGNPFIFGRGSEEAVALGNQNIEFEIIPGITAGTAAPIYAGIPITQRGQICQSVFVTAHESPDKPDTQAEWEALAKMKNTSIVIYMGASKIDIISSVLIKYGMDPGTPAAAIENGTLSKQRTITSTLEKIPGVFKENEFKAPCIIMFSPTVNLRQEIAWWEKKPLFNKRVLVTESLNYTDELYMLLSDLGADIIQLPLSKTEFVVPSDEKIRSFLKSKQEWIIFSKEDEVKYFFEFLHSCNLDIRFFGGKKIVSTGGGISELLNSYKITPDVVIYSAGSKKIIKEFEKKHDLVGKKFLRICEIDSREYMTREIQKSGGIVDELNLYKTVAINRDSDTIDNLKENFPDIFIFTNFISFSDFFDIFGKETAFNMLNERLIIASGFETTEFSNIKNIDDLIIHSAQNVEDIGNLLAGNFKYQKE